VIAVTVRGWFTYSAPEMGYYKEQRRYGVYGRHATAGNEIIIRDLPLSEVDAFLDDAHGYFQRSQGAPARIYIEDQALDARVGPALAAHAWVRVEAQSYLAHVGAPPPAVPVPGVTVEDVTPATLAVWVDTKLRGFRDDDASPDTAEAQTQEALRRAEMADVGRLRLARVAGEPAAILGWYEDADRFIFNLATRTPYRMRGIARQLLCEFLVESVTLGSRSVIINADTAGSSIQLYQRLGFTDEV
jgi:ribosomal protein S18 acetylase RimI-like enzyme